MAKLITTDEQLRSHLPNIIASVKGEVPFIERLALFLDLAEAWVTDTFVSVPTFNTICSYTDSNPVKILTARLVVADALRRAIPSLDIVLTPNGFGVVNTSNLAPASKPRVDRLVDSMLAHRDDCIVALLPLLATIGGWCDSQQGEFFGATLFPDLDICDALAVADCSRWQKYLELRSQVIGLETSLAEEWFSPELMSALRSEALRGVLTGKRKEIVRQVKAQVVEYLRKGSFSPRLLADLVNSIRLNENDFLEWHGSKTAQLFVPPVFRNKKEARGYFF